MARDAGPARGEADLAAGWFLIWRRYARFALLIGAAGGLLVYLALGLWASTAQTTYVGRFEVRYRAGTGVLAGLSQLVGRDLPSLRMRSTIETQLEILGSDVVRRGALRRLPEYSARSAEELRGVPFPFGVEVSNRSNTDIIVVEVRGPDRESVAAYAEALLVEYNAQDVRSKRGKDTELQKYVEEQIALQQRELTQLQQVLEAYEAARPLERVRERALERVTEAGEQLEVEGRRRRHTRDVLLAKYTPDHPKVGAAEAAIAALTSIAAAQAPDDLARWLAGADAQWAGLRQDALDDARRAEELDAEVERLRAQVSERFAGQLRAGSDPEQVQRELRLVQETYEGLRRRLSQIELSIQDTSSDLETLQEPTVSAEAPLSGAWKLALLTALGLALASPIVLESVVVTAHTVDDLELASGLPALAVLPKLDPTQTDPAGLISPGSAASDELRLLRTNIEAALDYPARRMILVAGAEPGEGKSLVAVNLARVYAEMGVPTLLVDLDLRRPRVHEMLGVGRAPGVTEVVREQASWRRAIQIPDIDGLHVLPAGKPVDDSSALLATVRLAEVLGEMREVFSVVICDSPALTAVADASFVARRADAVVLLYALATTPQRALVRTLRTLRTSKANVLGVVANDVRGLTTRRSYYQYYARRR